LHEGHDEHLTEIITHHDATRGQELGGMPLLPNMEAFRLGQQLDLGPEANYIGGLVHLDDSTFTNSTERSEPSPEYADFTTEEEDDSDEEDGEVTRMVGDAQGSD